MKLNFKTIKFNLKAKILLLTFVSIIIIATTITGVVCSKFLNTLDVSTIEKTESLTLQIKNSTENYLNNYSNVLTLMANSPSTKNINTENENLDSLINDFENVIKSYSDSTYIYLGTEDKKMHIYPKTDLGADYDPTQRPWYQQAIKANKLVWTEPYLDAITNKQIVSAVIPIHNNESKLVGVMGIDIDMNALYEKVTSIKLGKNGYPYISTETGVIVIHKNKDLIGADPVVPEIVEALKNNPNEGKVDYIFQGEKKTSVYKGIDNLNWVVHSSISKDEFKEETNKILITIVTIALFISFGTFLISYILITKFFKPINVMVNAMEQIKKGDLTKEANINSKDEIGVLANNFNNMIQILASLIRNAKNTLEEVNSASKELALTTEESTQSNEQISKVIEEIALGATEQAKDAETGASLISSFDYKFRQLVENSNLMSEKAGDVVTANKSGLVSIEKLVEKNRENNDTVQEVSKVLSYSNDKAKNISSIVETIKSFSEQTHLLALNASIEAARAGEQGKGFSVVAEEIRKLAYASGEATKQIDTIIQDIQNDTESSVSSMQKANNIVQEQTKVVDEVNNSFNNIANYINDIINGINQVNQYINDLDKDKGQIVTSIENISAVSEETAAQTEQMNASFQQQVSIFHEITKSSDKLHELSQNLDKELNQFKIK